MAEERVADVSLYPDGRSKDGKHMFGVCQVVEEPQEVKPLEKFGKQQHGELRATHDEFYITRPASGR
jgi:hypothetical protein